ncbi:chorismate-binding protein [Brackiella oedipodis]|uniref:chorismate-binding protein n=1 Tax=Brackiella oedipodis TaxID=124225 RepID=UPI0005705B67|nr:chorismate-binding protein [Brackiella oedipodis]
MLDASFFVLFDNAIEQQATLLQHYSHSDYLNAQQLDELDALLHKGWQAHKHCAFFVPYEFGESIVFGQTGRQVPENQQALALHWFNDKQPLSNAEQIKDFLQQQALDHAAALSDDQPYPAGICALHKDTSFEQYQARMQTIHEAIAKGDFYQVNYTIRQHFAAYGSPARLYEQLRQQQAVAYACLAHLPEAWQLCLSPELFFRINAQGLIQTEPMKGTLNIRSDIPLETQKASLRDDPKNRAENLMIVDLLRNDLAQLATPFGVEVEELFKVEPFGQVLQMTTPIRAQAKPQTTAAAIMRALFPCGSITGAPKKKSMEYIAQLEESPRALYTGSIGFLQPNPVSDRHPQGLPFTACFNVAIRTLTLRPQTLAPAHTDEATTSLAYDGVLGVGGGIVYDSTAASEYEEIDWKAGFIHRGLPEISLFETLRIEQQHCPLLTQHMARLWRSAQALNFKLPARDASDLERLVKDYLSTLSPQTLYRCKISLQPDGTVNFSHAPIQAIRQVSVEMATTRLANRDPLRGYKTSFRPIYQAAMQKSLDFPAEHFHEILFFNEAGFLLEGARSNVFVKYQDQWFTPALSLDILPGVMRTEVLAHSEQYLQTAQVQEAYIDKDMLQQAQALVLTNALRGCLWVE